MELIGAGLAALGVIGPGIGIGILGGMSSSAIGRNPDAAGQIRGLAIIVGLLIVFLNPAAAA
jgi:F-type H+-transporting ATPase subunit c